MINWFKNRAAKRIARDLAIVETYERMSSDMRHAVSLEVFTAYDNAKHRLRQLGSDDPDAQFWSKVEEKLK